MSASEDYGITHLDLYKFHLRLVPVFAIVEHKISCIVSPLGDIGSMMRFHSALSNEKLCGICLALDKDLAKA